PARTAFAGPDGELNWDKLPGGGVYTGHMATRLTGTSHGGATTHAYGVKVHHNSFGLNRTEVITAASGKQMSIAEEAHEAGKAVALVQSGHIAEPGTAVFAASSEERGNREDIARQVIESNFAVIMAGGERYLLPEGVAGRQGEGEREDGLNLIERAEELGYTIVYTRDELMGLDLATVDKVLGVFAHNHTFNDQERERNLIEGKPTYVESAPTIAEMADAALQVISRDEDGFFAVVEEEGTDNIPNNMNAFGTLEALRRADDAVGVLHDYVNANDDTLLLMAADSHASGMHLLSGSEAPEGGAVAATTRGGGVLHGQQGAFGDVFMSAPDAEGVRHPFGIAWVGYNDVAGGIVARSAGLNHEMLEPLVDNTEIYQIMHTTLFGEQTN
ncbi:MAG: alkaline phosphatase, partial [Pseudomonadota bacterium]